MKLTESTESSEEKKPLNEPEETPVVKIDNPLPIKITYLDVTTGDELVID